MEEVVVNSTKELAQFLDSLPDDVAAEVLFGEESTDGKEKCV